MLAFRCSDLAYQWKTDIPMERVKDNNTDQSAYDNEILDSLTN